MGMRYYTESGDPIDLERRCAEMFVHENSTALTIDSADKQHAVRGMGAGTLLNWTFHTGSTGAIADTANNGGTLRITDVAHGLTTGDIVTTTGLATASQNDVTAITKIDDNTFDCDDITFATIDETGTWNHGSHMIAGADGAGTYFISFCVSSTSASANHTFEFHVYVNTTQQTKVVSENKFGNTDIQSQGASGIVTIAVSDIVWLSTLNVGGTANITHRQVDLALFNI